MHAKGTSFATEFMHRQCSLCHCLTGAMSAGIARWELSALYDMNMDDNVSVLGQTLPLPLAGQCAALGTVLASLFVCAAAWAALQRQVRRACGLLLMGAF